MITLTANISGVIDLNYSNMRSIEGTIIDRKNIKMPSWGVVSNNGKVRFVDSLGNIKEMVENNQLTDKISIKMFLNNTISKYSEQIGLYWTKSWDYDNNSQEIEVTFSDLLEEMQSIKIPKKYYSYFKNGEIPETAKDLYISLRTVSNYKINKPKNKGFLMKSFEELEQITQIHLANITIKYPYINEGTLWGHWNKFCELTQTHIFVDKQGYATCKYNEGN
jgi:hypothetical protein